MGPHGHVCGHPTQQSSSNLAPNQDNRHTQEAGPSEEVHASPRCRFGSHVGRIFMHPGYLEYGRVVQILAGHVPGHHEPLIAWC